MGLRPEAKAHQRGDVVFSCERKLRGDDQFRGAVRLVSVADMESEIGCALAVPMAEQIVKNLEG